MSSSDWTLLGKLTALEYVDARTGRRRVLRWGTRRAPLLVYDSRGRLAVAYAARLEGRADFASQKEYIRTHWGQRGKGEKLSANVATPPFDTLGTGLSITYTTKKGADPELTDYVHEWGEGARGSWRAPTIVRHKCARCAGMVGLRGGSYRVDSRGIVG